MITHIHTITLSNEVVERIANCVDEKLRLEIERYVGSPTKKRIDQWTKHAFQMIYAQCFTARDIEFTTSRRIALAYFRFKKENAKGQAEGDDEAGK
jgi:hypothetical protein